MNTARLAIAALTLLCTASVASSFDECTSAINHGVDFSGGPFSLSGFGATDNASDPIRSCTSDAGHNTIWGTMTPSTDGILFVSGDASIAIYSGTCGALSEVACSTPTTTDSAFLMAGQTYYIELAAPPDMVTYTTAFCGDGNVQYQQCDDGNLIDTDGCTSACMFNVCGDGFQNVGVEACDDGNAANTDACTNACLTAVCGDGFVWTGVEACDDGNLVDGDGCDSGCAVEPFCGDGTTNGVEECDDGNGSNTDACTNGCLDAVCGDGFVRTGVEACDDGNLVGGDGCAVDCTTESDDSCAFATPLPLPVFTAVDLTNATTNPGDPVRSCSGMTGPNNRWLFVTPAVNGTLLMMTGFPSTTLYTGTCGALVEAACRETPGLVAVPATAGVTYTVEVAGTPGPPLFLGLSLCGDGITSFPEGCDDGNTVNTDACSNECQPAACGDGIIQDGEQCDDGNLVNGDGCEDDCFVTSVCGDGDVEGHETCDDGNVIDGDGCDGDCRLPCPDNLCKCLGAAKQFTVIAGKLGVKSGKYSEGGESEPIPNEIEGAVCGSSGTFSAKPGGETELVGDLVLTRPDGTAGNFKGYKEDGMLLPGTFLLGDLVTGGGQVKGLSLVQVDGVVDTSGAHALVTACNQARLDVAAAATTLAALTPTQTIAEIGLASDEEHTIVVGGGRQVLNIGSIKLKGYTAELDAASLTFQMGPTTDVLVVNAGSVFLGPGAEIVVEESSGAYAVLNLGPDGKATIKKEAFLGLPLIAPNASISLSTDTFADAIFTTDGVKLQGAGLFSSLECEE